MAEPARSLVGDQHRSNWVRLRTLTVLRWIAIAGQLAAIVVAQAYFELNLSYGLCYAVIGASVIANLLAIFVFPENKRLSEGEAFLTLLFDIGQLALLLFLTGGLSNPFALMILAPVTISATALRMRYTLVLGAVAILLITVVAVAHLPLVTANGQEIRMPPIFTFGFWAAITIGIVFEGVYARRVTSEIHTMSEALLATQMALGREQKLTDLGGVVAAAAHELGTPLATIKLVSSELIEELQDRPDLLDDARLVREQADRCRDILRSMGRAGKDDLHLRYAPLGEVIREAAEPHAGRGRDVQIDVAPEKGANPRHPSIARSPEIVHGLRNLVQNAVDFADSTVWIDGRWTANTIRIRIMDDGPGYPQHLLGRIGDPFVRNRRTSEERQKRPAYEGMGLGLFIAKTLLERSGASLTFNNAAADAFRDGDKVTRLGAIVELIWPRDAIGQEALGKGEGLGENRPIQT